MDTAQKVSPSQIPGHQNSHVKTYLEIGQEELLVEQVSFDGGGFSDIFRATWVVENKLGYDQVVVKRFRGLHNIKDSVGGEEDIKRMERRLRIEVETWKRAEPHPNILPFIGLYRGQYDVILPSLVSPYRPDRDMMYFVRKIKPDCDRRILGLHIGRGVAHLHSLKIIHGDLKPHNILIGRDENNAPIAQITDFGRAKIVNESGYTGSLHRTARYTSPEVIGIPGANPQGMDELDPSIANRILSFHSDTYGMGMTLLELLSNKPPYPRYNSDSAVFFALMMKKGPEITDNESPDYPMAWVWHLLTRCWMIDTSPDKRIRAGEFMVDYEKVLGVNNK